MLKELFRQLKMGIEHCGRVLVEHSTAGWSPENYFIVEALAQFLQLWTTVRRYVLIHGTVRIMNTGFQVLNYPFTPGPSMPPKPSSQIPFGAMLAEALSTCSIVTSICCLLLMPSVADPCQPVPDYRQAAGITCNIAR
jgi:hypothetical protein